MNINIRTSQPQHKFLSADMLAGARELARNLPGCPGLALTINLLVADIEAYREAFKGATAVVNQAGAMLKRQDGEIVSALNEIRTASRDLALAQLKATAILNVALKLRPVIDDEIEQRKHSGNAEDWAQWQALSDELHAAIKLVSR